VKRGGGGGSTTQKVSFSNMEMKGRAFPFSQREGGEKAKREGQMRLIPELDMKRSTCEEGGGGKEEVGKRSTFLIRGGEEKG